MSRLVVMLALLVFPVFFGCSSTPKPPPPAYNGIDLTPGDDGSGLIGAE